MGDPIILFFLFGILAGLLKSELRLPSQVYDFVSMLLLLSIGLKGGIEMAKQPFLGLIWQIVLVFIMGLVLPMLAFPVLRHLGRLSRADSASVAAHYGSVSVGTFAVAVAYFTTHNISFEAHMPLLVVVLEVPAILVGILLARGLSRSMNWSSVLHEIFAGKGVMLLLGGLCIGWIVGPDGVQSIRPVFFDAFKGILALFLLEMGLIASAKVGSLKQYGLFLALFGVVMPLVSSMVGILCGLILGFSPGGVAMLAVLAASASYIAVPAAMRISVPEANPTLSLAASLGVTFTFNVLFGIPIYTHVALWVHGALSH